MNIHKRSSSAKIKRLYNNLISQFNDNEIDEKDIYKNPKEKERHKIKEINFPKFIPFVENTDNQEPFWLKNYSQRLYNVNKEENQFLISLNNNSDDIINQQIKIPPIKHGDSQNKIKISSKSMPMINKIKSSIQGERDDKLENIENDIKSIKNQISLFENKINIKLDSMDDKFSKLYNAMISGFDWIIKYLNKQNEKNQDSNNLNIQKKNSVINIQDNKFDKENASSKLSFEKNKNEDEKFKEKGSSNNSESEKRNQYKSGGSNENVSSSSSEHANEIKNFSFSISKNK